MTNETYDKLTRTIRNNPSKVQVLKSINKVLTLFVYFLYPILLLILAIQQNARFWRVLLTPAVSFVLVSIFRKLANAPRPYEILDIDPLIKKDTKGQSFPSRHVFSVFVIALAFTYVYLPIGIALMILGITLAVVRVVGGVHFPKDVIVGAIIGILSGAIGFYMV